jgi:hypothetical protein
MLCTNAFEPNRLLPLRIHVAPALVVNRTVLSSPQVQAISLLNAYTEYKETPPDGLGCSTHWLFTCKPMNKSNIMVNFFISVSILVIYVIEFNTKLIMFKQHTPQVLNLLRRILGGNNALRA